MKKRFSKAGWSFLRHFMLVAVFLASGVSHAEERAWNFTPETVDPSTRFTALAVDAQGSVHLAYTTEGDRVRYAFRDIKTTKWFTTEIDARASFVSIALDSQGNPHLCYTQRTMRYAYWDGKDWHNEEVSPGSGAIAYYCAVAVSAVGVPHVTWYQERTSQDTNYLHMRHAVLDGGEWLAKTIDWDAQTGKWHSMVLDAQGNPRVSFDAFVSGQLKYATWNGSAWAVVPVDSRSGSQQPGRGMGNCLVLDSAGNAMISYFQEGALKYARQKEGGGWSIETLASTNPSPTWAGYRSSLALDSKGFPHIVYEDAGTLRHVYWDGKTWKKQLIEPAGAQRLRYGSIAISHDDVIYISFCDHADGSLKVSVGHLALSASEIESGKRPQP
jgi:hypothetical protein